MSLTLHTSLGDLKIELQCEKAPRLSHNFLGLCAAGFYDGTVFHRNVAQFLVQGGDPSGTGRGGVGLDGGLLDDEISEQLVHDRRGILAMANKGPNTNGSQFYITYGRQSQLDGTSSVIGRVIHGFETLDAMERVPVDDKYRPKRDISIQRVTIHANPFAN